MTRYGTINAIKATQTEQARPDQAANNAGGFVFEVGPKKQLDRFLILGQVGATYYASEKNIVKENADVVRKCLKDDGPGTVARIAEISDSGRAPKNDPAIFALAIAASSKDPATRHAALEALPKVCRTGTHLFHFAADVNSLRGWGRGLRTAIGKWYTNRSEESLANQLVKYQQRDGWSNRDLLRLSHPTPSSPARGAMFRWVTGNGIEALDKPTKRGVSIDRQHLPDLIAAHEVVHTPGRVVDETMLSLIREYRMPREALPTQWLNDPKVWEALLPHMGPTAMIRNLAKMTSLGMLKPMGQTTKFVSSVITSSEALKRARVHPMQLLLAMGIYLQGKGEKGKLTWTPERAIVDALDAGFYEAFASIEPTGKNTMICLDVSGSMDSGTIAGCPGISPRAASVAMAMVTARVEPNYAMMAFSDKFMPLDIRKNEPMDAIVRKINRLPFRGTDCSLPMQYAMKEKLEVDVFQVYTDNETYAGAVHPYQALRDYRQKSGRDARLCVVGLTATNFTIADPRDAGMLDVVGMDTHAPALMAAFGKGEV